MIVCVCNRITENEVREAAHKGALTPESAYASLDCEVQCGCCLDYAQDVIDEEAHQSCAGSTARSALKRPHLRLVA